MFRSWDLSQVSFLIIDDNIHMRSILRSVLTGFGARCLYEAADGAEGIEMVMDRNPDVVLCDWAMKPLSGWEFLSILRADHDPELNTVPVIMVSAHSQKSVILEALKVGIHGFVAKPVSPAVLYRRIADVLIKQAEYGRSKGIAFGCDADNRWSSRMMPEPEPDVIAATEQVELDSMAFI